MSLASLISWVSKDYDFYKGTIVATGGASILFLGLCLFQMSQASALGEAIAYGERDLKEIYEMADKVEAFNQELKGDPFADAGNDISGPISKFFFAANMGQAAHTSRTEKSGAVETVTYTITAGEKDRIFNRSQIVNFLQRLEGSTTRARVTGIKLSPPGGSGRNIVPGQRREDDWTCEFRVTTRRRIEASK